MPVLPAMQLHLQSQGCGLPRLEGCGESRKAGELPLMDCYGLLWLGYYYYYGLLSLGTRIITFCFLFIMYV